jgi:hypothetical protein
MENRTEMLRRVTALARENPEAAETRLHRVSREWAADRALTAPLLRALGLRDAAEIEAERAALQALTRRGPIG